MVGRVWKEKRARSCEPRIYPARRVELRTPPQKRNKNRQDFISYGLEFTGRRRLSFIENHFIVFPFIAFLPLANLLLGIC
jgi:hypothetical protein